MAALPSYAVSSLVGGVTPGARFSDIFYMRDDGKLVLNDTANSVLNSTRSIHQIAVSTSWVVDGVSVTYSLEGGNTTSMDHGSVFDPPSGVVSFGENEILASVYGRSGYHSYYGRNLVTSIAFVVFNTETEESRTAGPFGSGDGANEGQGQPFEISDVIALGSFSEPASTLGLSGLFFHKNPLASIQAAEKAMIPAKFNSTNLTSLD